MKTMPNQLEDEVYKAFRTPKTADCIHMRPANQTKRKTYVRGRNGHDHTSRNCPVCCHF